MDTQELAAQIIKFGIESQRQTGKRAIEVAELLNHLQEKIDDNELSLAFHYLSDQSYIKTKFMYDYPLPPVYVVNGSGIDWMSSYFKKQSDPVIQQNINFENNYGAVGTNSNFVINNQFSFEKLQDLIENNTEEGSQDRIELEEIKSKLQTIEQHNIPISKGYFSHFSDIIQKNSWLSGPLASFLLNWITRS